MAIHGYGAALRTEIGHKATTNLRWYPLGFSFPTPVGAKSHEPD